MTLLSILVSLGPFFLQEAPSFSAYNPNGPFYRFLPAVWGEGLPVQSHSHTGYPSHNNMLDHFPRYRRFQSDMSKHHLQGSDASSISHRTPCESPEPSRSLPQRSPPDSPAASQPSGPSRSAPASPSYPAGPTRTLSNPTGMNPHGNFLQNRANSRARRPPKMSPQKDLDYHSLTQLGMPLTPDETEYLLQVRRAIRNLVYEFEFNSYGCDKPIILKEGANIFINLFRLPWFLDIEKNNEGSLATVPILATGKALTVRALRLFEGMRVSSPIQKGLTAWIVGCPCLAEYFVKHADDIVRANRLFKHVDWAANFNKGPDVENPPQGKKVSCNCNATSVSVGMMMAMKALNDAHVEAFRAFNVHTAGDFSALDKISLANLELYDTRDPLQRNIRKYIEKRIQMAKGVW